MLFIVTFNILRYFLRVFIYCIGSFPAAQGAGFRLLYYNTKKTVPVASFFILLIFFLENYFFEKNDFFQKVKIMVKKLKF